MAGRERDALICAFGNLKMLADNALTPRQKAVAIRAAAACLWGLDIDEHSGIKAERPRGGTIDLVVVRALQAKEPS